MKHGAIEWVSSSLSGHACMMPLSGCPLLSLGIPAESKVIPGAKS